MTGLGISGACSEMKAQVNSRGQKDFICREFTVYRGMQGDPETGDLVGQDGEGVL
jgi:hypothetical protein